MTNPSGSDSLKVAIIGMAVRVPGARSPEQLWSNLCAGVESIQTFSDEDLREAGVEPEALADPGFIRAGGVLDDIQRFDAAFFDFNPREAELTDPQQRIFLECCWEAIEAAGYPPDGFPGSIGVFAGASLSGYFLNNVLSRPELLRTSSLQALIGSDKDYLAPRISYKLNLRGPSVSVQTACSTSLVAVHLACQSLQDYQCDLALAGGISIRVPQRTGYWFQEGGIYSPDGHCRPFDAAAQGTVIGSGAGVVVLKRLADALADGDRIRAVILGSAVNNDGAAKVGFTAPSIEGQVAVISEALAAAGVSGKEIEYVETHGTGTPLGDPVEVAALTRAFGVDGRERPGSCALGAIKASLGHLDTAAGVAGLIKAALAVEHGLIPPSPHFLKPNPEIDFGAGPFYVNPELRAWQGNGSPRRAGVSSFGIGGTNAHVVLEEAPRPRPTTGGRSAQLLLLSARTASALETMTSNLADHLRERPDLPLSDAAYTLQVGRKTFRHRRMLVCGSPREAVAALDRRDPERVFSLTTEAQDRPVVFLFSGQGTQYPGMGAELYQKEPVYRRWIDRCAELLAPSLGLDLRSLLHPAAGEREEAERRLEQTALAQPALFAVEYALARLWMEWGVRPAAMIGHSVGELVAACLAGVFSLEDALGLVAVRGELMQRLPAGAMLSVPLSDEEARSLLDGEGSGGLALAAVNAPGLCVIAGPEEPVEALRRRLAAQGVEARRLHTSHAFHSPSMDPAVEPFAARVARVRLAPPSLPFVSNVTGTWIRPEEATDPGYWGRHLRQPVRFAAGLAELLADRTRLLLEVGPGRTLGTFARQHPARAREQAVLTSLRHPQDPGPDQDFLLGTLGRLWLAGARIDWAGFHADESRRRELLPTYPFEGERYWIEPRRSTAAPPGPAEAAPATAAGGPASEAEEILPGHARPELATAYVAPRDEAERRLAEIWQRGLGLREVGVYDDFFELGGHSLLATQIAAEARRAFGIETGLRELFEAPTVAGMAARVGSAAAGAAVGAAPELLPVITPDPEHGDEPFPLTDVQQAYWIGRGEAFELGNVATHVYIEAESREIEPERLARAWRRLIDRHGMLRAVVLQDGRQRILPTVPRFEIPVLDLRGRAPEDVEAELEALRRQMFEQVHPSDRWPLFEIRATLLPDGRRRFHHSFDLLIGDAWSWQILFHETAWFYREPEAELPPLTLSFRDYVLTLVGLEESAAFQRDLAYWRSRLDDFPPAPDLPLAASPSALERPRFVRRTARLEPEVWQRLKERGSRAGLTTSAILLAAFSEVLAVWSRTPRFTLNLTLFNRLPLHPEVNALVGDFTSLTLLAVDAGNRSATFEERARGLQAQLWEDLDHRLVSGVRVLREIARRQGTPPRALQPVVFTSTLNMGTPESLDTGSPQDLEGVYGISQTPQVWLDHQVTEEAGALVYNWDAVEDLFPPGLLADLFDAYYGLLERLALAETWERSLLSLTPPEHLARRAAVNATSAPVPAGLLHAPFLERAAEAPERPAVIAPDRTLSYGELARRSRLLAHRLRQMGAGPNRLVAVVMEKGWEQVVAVLGILEAGAAYLPVDPELPAERRFHLLEQGEVEIALTQPWLESRLAWPPGIQSLPVRAEEEGVPAPLTPVQSPDDLAYVIFTSGSTGQPKGVMIDHRGALNTIVDINQRFAVGPDDRVLGLSSLSFDLSVYDVFGVLAAGGALVLPSAAERRDPEHWAERVESAGVTVWNSVPALLEMLVDFAETRGRGLPPSLRLALLSGDWIPLSLPDRLRARSGGLRLISLGGATEASIWSIFYPVEGVDPSWKSIPYGRPLANQSFHVLDESLEPRPDWVTGSLYIGGIGLALGYWRDAEKTAAAFLVHPRTGERLYRTGDLGRSLPNGEIELVGREDLQVKIRGHRIELGEVEAALRRHPAVREAVAVARGERSAKRLVAYVVADPGVRPESGELRSFLQDILPGAMIPSAFVVLEAFPLTANGKVDRQALPDPGEAGEAPRTGHVAPRTAAEEVLARIFGAILGLERLGAYDDFFALGGDSLMATKAVFQIRREFQVELPVLHFFDSPTVAGLAERVEAMVLDEIERMEGDPLAAPAGPPSPPLPAVPVPQHVSWGETASEESAPMDAALWRELVEAGTRQARSGGAAEDLRAEALEKPLLDRRIAASLGLVLAELGGFTKAEEIRTVDELIEGCGILPRYRKALRRWLETLADNGCLERIGDRYRSPRPLPPAALTGLLTNEDRKEILGQMLPLLRGEQHPLEMFIPGGSSRSAESSYTELPIFRYCNGVAAAVMARQVASLPPGRRLRVLEVGAGTGGTTASLLPLLPPERTVYTYTDVSRFFLDLGREKFQAYPFLQYGLLNIEEDPGAQGYPPGGYDWVVAAHVLHATRDIRETLRHTLSLLAPGGVLLLLEETSFQPKYNLSMGFLPGFDQFEDRELRPLHPLLTSAQWGRELTAAGFAAFATFTEPDSAAETLGVDVMLGRA